MDVSYNDQIALSDYLINKLEMGLSGRDEPECHDGLPHDRYHLGILAPQQQSLYSLSQPDTDIAGDDLPDAEDAYSKQKTKTQKNKSDDSLSSQTDEEESVSTVENEDGERFNREDILNRRGAPTAMGFELIVAPSEEGIILKFEVAFAIYFRRFPTWEQQQRFLQQDIEGQASPKQHVVTLADRHVRKDLQIEPFQISLSPGKRLQIEKPFDDKIEKLMLEEKKDVYVWREIGQMSVPRSKFDSLASYENYLKTLNGSILLPPIHARLDVRTIQMPNGNIRIGIYIVNITQADENYSMGSVINTQRHLYDVRMSCSVQSGEIVPVELIASPENYQYDPEVWAVGQNCAAQVNLTSKKIWTESLAKYQLPRLITKNILEASFENLQEDPLGVLESISWNMEEYAVEWDSLLQSGDIPLKDDKEFEACQSDLSSFKNETKHFIAGLNALQSDSKLLESFKAMHRVFMRVGASRNITKWRLFQICFIVTQLPALAAREDSAFADSLNYADVLWFPTGGGKTEAYLGLISCALLYDRLRGKTRGVTAWLRFPLRMLSVQQLQRAVRVLYETEQERQSLFGKRAKESDPISLGYFVGNSSTPNQLNNAEWSGKWKISELASREEIRNQLRMIRECPRCSTPTVEINVDVVSFRLRHICRNCGLDLNIFVSDDEIYRYLPSVLIGTVDKLPSIAWRKHFAHIWGAVDSQCPVHGYASGQYCIVYGCKETRVPVSLYDPVPALQVQDELHLLREELGTFAGHYETLAEMCQARSTLPPKIIAATATVEGLDRQTRHLYARPARRFPSRGYRRGESFYTHFDTDDTGDVKISRRYLAFKPPYLRPPEASTRVLEINHQSIRELYDLLINEGAEVVSSVIGLSDLRNETELIELLDKYDTTLTYVGSKAHGSRIERVLTDSVRKSVTRAGKREMEVKYLNGESSLDEIADTIGNLETESDWDSDTRLDAVIGTSVVSHGVDVSRFNFMVMSGMPGRTAEYIQASSRSGRTYVGMIVVVLSPWLLREQSFYHRFASFHEHMDHMVEPVPINRFSKFAANKTLPGVLAGLLNAYLAPEHHIELDKVQKVERAMHVDNFFSEDDLLGFVFRAFDVESKIHSSSLQGALKERVRERYRAEMRRLMAPGSAERVTDAMSRKPMTSLRDIDEAIPFEPKEYAYFALRWTRR